MHRKATGLLAAPPDLLPQSQEDRIDKKTARELSHPAPRLVTSLHSNELQVHGLWPAFVRFDIELDSLPLVESMEPRRLDGWEPPRDSGGHRSIASGASDHVGRMVAAAKVLARIF